MVSNKGHKVLKVESFEDKNKKEYTVIYSLIDGMENIEYSFFASNINEAINFVNWKFDTKRFVKWQYKLEISKNLTITFEIE